MKKKILLLCVVLLAAVVGGYFYAVKLTSDNLKIALENVLLPLKNSSDKNNKVDYVAINSSGIALHPSVEIEKFAFNLKDENNLEIAWQDEGKLNISLNYFTHSMYIGGEGITKGSLKRADFPTPLEFKSQSVKPFACQIILSKPIILDALLGKSAEVFADGSGLAKAIEKAHCSSENNKILDNKTGQELASIALVNLDVAINRKDNLLTGSSAKLQIKDEKISEELCKIFNPNGSSTVCAEKTAGAHNFDLGYELSDLGANNNQGKLKGNLDYHNKISKLNASIDGNATNDALDVKLKNKITISPEAVAMQRADIVKISNGLADNIEKSRGAKFSDEEKSAILNKVQHNLVEPLVELHDFEMNADFNVNGLSKKGAGNLLDIRNINLIANDYGIILNGKGNQEQGDFNLQCLNCEKTVRGGLSIMQGLMEIAALKKASKENPSISSEAIDQLVHIVQSVGEADAKNPSNLNIHIHNNTPDKQWIIGKLQANQVVTLLMAAQAAEQKAQMVKAGENIPAANPAPAIELKHDKN